MVLRFLRRLRGSPALKLAARAGLVARGVFYLLLAALVLRLLISGAQGRETNANGALTSVADTPVGLLLLAAAAAGFAAFGVVRLAGALSDDRHGRIRRASTAGQALVYLGLASTTATFVLGRRSTGSERQQHRMAASLLALPAGRLIVVGIGLVMLGVCTWQLIVAAKGHFQETLHTEQMSPAMQRLTDVTARIGIPARALAFAPVGVFLVAAGAHADQRAAKGLDGLLMDLVRTGWGRLAVLVMAVGFVVFAAYSFLEARFRQVSSGA